MTTTTRHPRPGRSTLGGSLFCAGLLGLAAAPADAATYADIAPILQARCVMCHSGDNAPLGLKLDSLDGLKRGSSNGPVATAGSPDASATCATSPTSSRRCRRTRGARVAC